MAQPRPRSKRAAGAHRKPPAAWQGQLTFGMITFPVRALTGAREDKISFNQICPTHRCRTQAPTICPGGPVIYQTVADLPEEFVIDGQVDVDALEAAKGKCLPDGTFEVIEPRHDQAKGECLKGIEHKPTKKYLIFSKAEIEAAAPEASPIMKITQFVQAGEVDAIYFDNSYLLCPDEGAGDPFRLLRLAMQQGGWMAIAKIVMRGNEQMVALRPYRDGGMLMHTLYRASEIREIAEEGAAQPEGEADAAMVGICGQLIGALAAPFDPEQFTDERTEKLKAAIEAKAAGKEITAAVPAPKKAPVLDMMAALQASLASLKGGAGKEEAAAA
jgi:DNA end-binding protein Ku